MTRLYHISQNVKLSKNFHSGELACECCGYALIDTDLIEVAENIRSIVGVPVYFTSGYRCPKRNHAVGGKLLSTHLLGCGGDLTWHGIEHDLRNEAFRFKIRNLATKLKLMGIGWGDYFLHVDTYQGRKALTEWTYKDGLG